jgi:4-amino-4-deoxy-L-arabinose transferase-like glycosyltransferase
MAQSGKNWWWIILLLLYVAFLGIRGLDMDTLYFDERRTIQHLGDPYAPHTFPEVVESIIRVSPQHTPGYFLIMRLWLPLVGYSQTALRYFSVLMGLLGLAMLYRLGSDHFSPRVGLYAAVLTGTTALYSYYLHEIRMYTLLLLLIAFVFWLYLRLIDDQHRVKRWEWAAFFGGAVALIYTHVFAIFPLFAIGLYHLLGVKKNRRWWQISGALTAAGVIYLPWFSISMAAARDQDEIIEATLTPLDAAGLIPYLFANGSSVLVGVLGVGIVVALFSRHRSAWVSAYLVIGAFLGLIIVNAFTPIMVAYRARYFLIFWPPLALLFGAGLAQLCRWSLLRRWSLFRRWPIIGTLVMMVWLITGLHFTTQPEFEFYTNRTRYGEVPPYAQISSAIQRLPITPQPTDLLLVIADDSTKMHLIRPIGKYYFKLLQMPGFVVRPRILGEKHNDLPDHTQSLETLAAYPVIWFPYLLDDLADDDLKRVTSALERSHIYCDTLYAEADLQIHRYAKQPFGCTLLKDDAQPLVQYADLDTALLSVKTIETAPDELQVATTWSVGKAVPIDTYSVSLKVFNAEGDLIDQVDFSLPTGKATWQQTPLTTDNWPAGIYDLQLTVYAWQTGAHIIGQRPSDTFSGAEITVHQVTLSK